ncbi:SDR family NAD(P)-dependent oxidoreductase [Paraliomyxa miuraensis]|uniref:SDR family NAD(P)-dependent oxidoreductase n=1 Tax=Paraliomyxa miuraensis TaxID=376150 RepID=UPI00224DB998|nr:SDR family oxidoreductase [Paraliomyxa miuraensis]MCX4241932.1 SDR family oxidoreductase [Paraliomyxa miuraensis]
MSKHGEHFANKVAVVTGGASGIGRALGQELLGHGAEVILADIDRPLLERTVAQLGARGGRVRGAPLDVTDRTAVTELLAAIRRDHGRLDLVFNNAGINVCAELRDTTLEDWDRLIEVNLKGVVYGTAAAYEIMREQGSGHIVNTASVAGLAPSPGEGAYSATKHAVVGLSTALRAEARAFGVAVSVVCPGIIDTPLVHTTKYVGVTEERIRALLPIREYPVERTAREILRGVAANRGIITITRFAKLMWGLYRWWPEASTLLAQPLLRRVRKDRGRAPRTRS